MKQCSYCGKENEASLAMCQGCGTSLPKSEIPPLLAQTPKSGMTCPACGVPETFTEVAAFRSSFSWIAFLMGGFLAVLFHNASREVRVQCNACEKIFGIQTP